MQRKTGIAFVVGALALMAQEAVVLDRIAVVVGTHAILSSEIDRDVRVTAFLNGAQLAFTNAAKRQAISRLVDQQIIRTEIETGDYARPPASDVDAFVRSVIRQRFGTETRYRAALRESGLTEAELHSELAWQLTVLRFIDERFRPEAIVTDEDVGKYYQQHRADLQGTLDQEESKIRRTIEAQRINEQFLAWLDNQRKQMRVEYREGALRS